MRVKEGGADRRRPVGGVGGAVVAVLPVRPVQTAGAAVRPAAGSAVAASVVGPDAGGAAVCAVAGVVLALRGEGGAGAVDERRRRVHVGF